MATTKVIPEHFGKAVMTAISNFAKSGIADESELDSKWFEHVKDNNVRTALCDTFHGARWIYKLGLALLVDGKECYAHVRAQVIDYGSICETLLAEMILHGLEKGKLKGQRYRFADNAHHQPIRWAKHSDMRKTIERQKFWWHIAVAKEEGIIDAGLSRELDGLRNVRNTVHLTEKINSNTVYHLNMSARALETLQKTINQTKSWYNRHK